MANRTSLPPIEHITQNYVSLRTLILAVSERCGKELANVLRTSENLHSDLARKEQFLKFVVASRQEFVKLYVLCKWAVVSKDISVAIDVTNWLHGQVNCFNNVVTALFHLQAGLGPAKSPWADLETALEVLKYGRPTPTLEAKQYIPAMLLSDRSVLNTLRRLDVLIAMRLALHEQLPSYYRAYRVRDGRARFLIGDGALWVELSIADEDVANQCRFFYVDCGLVNRIHTDTLLVSEIEEFSSKFKLQIEQALNEMLASSSLVEALNWLSQFAAIYKLQLLSRQLRHISRGSGPFSGVVRHHCGLQSLTIFCFTTTKSPAETVIKISSVPPYSLEIASEYGIDLTRHLVDAGHILSRITRYHAAKRMQAVEASWITPITDFCVSFEITPSRSVELSIDTTSGLLVLSSSGPVFAKAQHKLNSSEPNSISIVDTLSRLRAQVCLDTVADRAEAAGWRAHRNVRLAPDEYAKIQPATYLLALRFPKDTSGWALCVAYGGGQPHWFATRLQCSQRRWVLGPIHELSGSSASGTTGSGLMVADPDYGCLVELMSVYNKQFVLFELMRELTLANARHTLKAYDGENKVVVDITTILEGGAHWAQSGLICTVKNGIVTMEGRAKSRKLQALGTITEKVGNSEIYIDGNIGKFTVSHRKQNNSLQPLVQALGFLNHAAKSLTSATSLGLEVRSATLSSLEIKYVAPHGMLVVQNNAKIIFGAKNPQQPLAPFLPAIDEHSKSSLVRIVTFLREWYPVWDIITSLEQSRGIVMLPQSINRLRVQLGVEPSMPFLEVSLRNFRRQYSVNFLTAGNGAELHELVKKYFSERVSEGVVPLVSGCAIEIGHENVLQEILHALTTNHGDVFAARQSNVLAAPQSSALPV